MKVLEQIEKSVGGWRVGGWILKLFQGLLPNNLKSKY